MAKGVEDTAFYRFNRLVSLNDVGGDPRQFGVSVEAYHRSCLETQERWPTTMLTTSTHDTKRGEDVRLRINLLSEIPNDWSDAVSRWSAMNEGYRHGEAPDRNTEYLLYQTLVGAWPIEPQRIQDYMEKSAREAKRYTYWTSPDDAYEGALHHFVAGILNDEAFVADLESFITPLLEPARITSIAQTLLKMTAPGIPDIYQGSELWDLSLVDPDNRRPVDYCRRRELLKLLDGATPECIWSESQSGLPKLWVIRQALSLRQSRPELFGPRGSYEPLYATGARSSHLVAASRGGAIVTAVPRLVLGLAGQWADTRLELPGDRWRNVLTGEDVTGPTVRVEELLRRFPVALLERLEAAS
jgi:(1->4)-alpha-D-glucan 1-alpha-D-glucosylmutase